MHAPLPPRRTALVTLILLLVTLAAFGPTAAAEDAVPADPEPRWWKGNLHTHTLWSDGNDFPEMVAEWYRTHGYDFLALSDHNILSEGEKWMSYKAIRARGGVAALPKYRERFGDHWVETRGSRDDNSLEIRLKPLNEFRALMEQRGEFIMIQGEETTDGYNGRPVHMNATNLGELIPPQHGDSVRDTIRNNLRAVREQAKELGRPILPHLNHPNFHYAITAEDIAAVTAERFFEVYNGHPSVGHLGDSKHPGVERLWDIANTLRIAEMDAPPLFGMATDDSHTYHKGQNVGPGRGWVMVRSRHLTPESLIESMRAGDFYASSGVRLEDVSYDRESGKLSLSIDAAEGASYTTRFIGTPTGHEVSGEPRRGEDGETLDNVTKKYAEQVGKVLATVKGANPSYELSGDELYVRAVVTSSEAHDRPSFKGQKKQAWTQPVGWRERVESEE